MFAVLEGNQPDVPICFRGGNRPQQTSLHQLMAVPNYQKSPILFEAHSNLRTANHDEGSGRTEGHHLTLHIAGMISTGVLVTETHSDKLQPTILLKLIAILSHPRMCSDPEAPTPQFEKHSNLRTGKA